MMKKKNNFGWTIFEKSFTLLLVSFLLVNCLNVFLDYKFAKEDVIDALSSRKITPAFIELNKTFSQKYHSIYNEEFLETVNTFLEDTNYQYEYDWEILILDDQYNLVHTNEHPLYIDFMVISMRLLDVAMI